MPVPVLQLSGRIDNRSRVRQSCGKPSYALFVERGVELRLLSKSSGLCIPLHEIEAVQRFRGRKRIGNFCKPAEKTDNVASHAKCRLIADARA